MIVSRHGKRAVLASFAALLAALVSCPVRAASPPTTIYPTGSFPLDVSHVQAALDGGGTVLLKATNAGGLPTAFNFGPSTRHGGRVRIHNDVAITGERVGGSMTTIAGGYLPIVELVPAKTHITGLVFEAPAGAAIVILASTGTEIDGNVINGVVPVLLSLGFTDGDGIDLFGNDDPANAITGKVRITGNVIRNLTADFANGMQLDEVAADVEITGNTVQFPESNGSIQTVGITAFRSHGTVTISRNTISMGPGSTDAFPAPIFAGGEHEARYRISDNDIQSDHPNGDGIILNGGDFSEPTNGANVTANRVRINSTFPGLGGAGVSLYGAVNGSIVSGNKIEGASAFALQITQGFLGGESAAGNRLLGNDISGHVDLTADVYLDVNTSDTLVAGSCVTAIDLGVANRVNCGQNGHASAGRRAGSGRRGLGPYVRRELIEQAKASGEGH